MVVFDVQCVPCTSELRWGLIQGRVGLSRETKTSLSLATSGSSRGIPRCSKASQETAPLQCVLGVPWGLLPVSSRFSSFFNYFLELSLLCIFLTLSNEYNVFTFGNTVNNTKYFIVMKWVLEPSFSVWVF